MSISNYSKRYWKNCTFSLTNTMVDFTTSGCGRSYSDLLWNNIQICSNSTNCIPGGGTLGLSDQCYQNATCNSSSNNLLFIINHTSGPYVGSFNSWYSRGLQNWYVR